MAQKIVGLCHDPLFQVFLNVLKSYDSLYRGIYMETLRGYGLRPNV